MIGVPMLRRLGASRFARGVLSGFLIIVVARAVINGTTLADWIIAPLLLSDTAGRADAIVVPGAGVVGNCAPNQNAVRRVLLATRLWRQHQAPLIVFTGGSNDRSCPVAAAMAALANELGVPTSSIRVESGARSTRENATFTAPLLREWGIENIVIVTDRLHMRRAAAVFMQQGFEPGKVGVPIYEGHPDNVSMLRAGIREYVALAYYRLRGWTSAAPDFRATPRLPLENTTRWTVQHPTGPLVILGASYAQGWNLSSVSGRPVINRGLAGQQSFELLERFDKDVAANAPRAVILWGFINDIFRAPEGGMDQTVARIRKSYTEMIQRARAEGIEPILATEVTARPRNQSILDVLLTFVGDLMGKQSYQDQINRHVLAVNTWIEETGAREGILVLRFQSLLADESGRRRKPFAQPDGSHITASGYDRMSAYATPILEEHFVAR